MNKKTRYAPIWQRIEGDWKRYVCSDCSSVSFVVVDTDDVFVRVRCAAGHDSTVMIGFAMTKPDG